MHMTKCDIIISTPLYKSSHCYDIRHFDNITKLLHYNQAYNQSRKGNTLDTIAKLTSNIFKCIYQQMNE